MKKYFLCAFMIISVLMQPVYATADSNENLNPKESIDKAVDSEITKEEESVPELVFDTVDSLTTFVSTSSAMGNGVCVIVGEQGRIRVSNIDDLKNYKSIFLNESKFIKVFFIKDKFIALSEEGNVYESNSGEEWSKKKVDFHLENKIYNFTNSYAPQRIIEVLEAFYVNNKLILYCYIEIGGKYRNAILESGYESDYKVSQEYIFDELEQLTGGINYHDGRYYLIIDQYEDRSRRKAIHKLIGAKELHDFGVIKEFDVRINGMLINEDLYLCYGHGGEAYSLDDWDIVSTGNNGKNDSHRVIYYSEDGLKWNEGNATTGDTNGGFMKVVFDGEKYIGGGHNAVGVSYDGVDWKVYDDISIYTCDIETTGDETIILGKDGDKNYFDLNFDRYIINDFTNRISRKKIDVLQSDMIFKNQKSFFLLGDKMGISEDGVNWDVEEGIEIRDSGYRGITSSKMGYHIISKYDFFTSEDGVEWENYTQYINKNETFKKVENYTFNNVVTDGSKIYIYGSFWGKGWEKCVWITEDLKKWDFKPLRVEGYSASEIQSSKFSIEQIQYLNGEFILLGDITASDIDVAMFSEDGINFKIISKYEDIEKEDNKRESITPRIMAYDNGYYYLVKEKILWKGSIGTGGHYTLEKSKDLIKWTEIDIDKLAKSELVDFDVLNGKMIFTCQLYIDHEKKTVIAEAKEGEKWKYNEFEDYYFDPNIDSNDIFEDKGMEVCIIGTKIFYKDSHGNWKISNTPRGAYYISSSEVNGERIYIGENTVLKSKIMK